VPSLLALAAGAASAFAFAPYDLWPLALLGIAALIALIDKAPNARTAFWRGWLFGTGHFALGLTWIATAFTFQAKMPAMLGWVAVLLLAMFLALYIGLAALLTHRLARTMVGRTFVLAAAWMLAEWLRGWVLSGFAWNPLGAATLPVAGLGQGAAIGGALGLSGIIVLAGGGLWAMVAPRAAPRQRAVGAGLFAVITVAALAGTPPDARPAPNGPPIFVVQPNIGQDVKYAPGADEAHLQTYLDMTRRALVGGDMPAIVLWSESSVFGLVEEDPELRARLAEVLGPGDLLLFGGVAAIRDAAGNLTALTNSLFVIDAAGVLQGRYDKAHLVPLGEYVPARSLMEAIGLARLTPGDIDFQPGPGPKTLALPGMPSVGVQICYEIIFGGAVVDGANRPAWLANISNDAWFGPSGPPQHLAQTRLRAIEEGLPVARATPTGISAIIDARGRVVSSVAQGVADTASAPLPAARSPTPFARWGHLTSLAWGLLLLAAGLVLDRRQRAPMRAGAI
jgi:apolipoprotein N-acyltransferase